MNSYSVYWKENGKLCRMDVGNIARPDLAILAVKEHLRANDVGAQVLRRVFAVVK